MSISWDTQCALPRLRSYTDAKRHHDSIKPIRGNKYEPRPAGRRDQKWFSIWEEKNYHESEKPIHIGYGSCEHDARQKLITFHPGGSVDVHPYSYASASTNERIGAILGARFQTHQYDVWVYCNYYDSGEHKAGWMPLKRSSIVHNRTPDTPDVPPASFTFNPSGAPYASFPKLTYLNYTYPVTHKLNKEHFKEAMAPYLPFMRYVQNMIKLGGENYLIPLSADTREEAFGRTLVPSMRWGIDKPDSRAKFFKWAASDDLMDQLRALITLEANTYGYCPNWEQLKGAFQEFLIRTHKLGVLDQTQHKEGKLVRDKYRKFLID